MGWQAVEYLLENGKVVAEKPSEPDFKALAIEKFNKLTLGIADDE